MVSAQEAKLAELRRGSRPEELQVQATAVSNAELAKAEAERNIETVKKAIEYGVELNSNSGLDFPLREAIRNAYGSTNDENLRVALDIITLLVEHGADINKCYDPDSRKTMFDFANNYNENDSLLKEKVLDRLDPLRLLRSLRLRRWPVLKYGITIGVIMGAIGAAVATPVVAAIVAVVAFVVSRLVMWGRNKAMTKHYDAAVQARLAQETPSLSKPPATAPGLRTDPSPPPSSPPQPPSSSSRPTP